MSRFIASANIFAVILIKGQKLISCVFIRNVSGLITSANIFAVILIKGHKVDFLCLYKKRVWSHYEC